MRPAEIECRGSAKRVWDNGTSHRFPAKKAHRTRTPIQRGVPRVEYEEGGGTGGR